VETASLLRHNLSIVRDRMVAACERSGRDPNSVRMIAVTKYVDADIPRRLVELGVHDLGESRPQVLWDKGQRLQDLEVRWHMIGHLQRNKARRTLTFSPLIHSIDSLRLARTINDIAAECGRTVRGLAEVNISGEANKHGFDTDETADAIGQMLQLPNLELVGLMGMASLSGSPDDNRREFRRLRELRDQCRESIPGSEKLTELSMGMSHDFEMAIEEGATMVRIGSLLFEGIVQ